MKRRDFIRLTGGAAAAMLGGASGVLADAVGDDIARQLRRRGYSDISVSRTLLGRVRVTGRRGMLEREIIVNPNSGEILRDLVIDSRTGTTSSSLFDDNGSDGRSGSGSGRSDDDSDDGDGDDDRSESSGSGSSGRSGSNSGSGSSGSNSGSGSSGSNSGSGSSGGSDDGGGDDNDSDDRDDSSGHGSDDD
jgi:hypothetical protein